MKTKPAAAQPSKTTTNATTPPEPAVTTVSTPAAQTEPLTLLTALSRSAPIQVAIPAVGVSMFCVPSAPIQVAIPAVGVSMFCVPDKGWTLVELKLLMTSSGPELVSWENVGEEPYLPKTHVDNMLRRFCAYHYLYPQGG